MEYSSNSRWWETYLVRYITGSVIGAVIVYIILKKSGIDLIPHFDDIKNSNLIVLFTLGFAYCYLASAPITLLHAVRSLVGKAGGLDISNFMFISLLALVAIIFALLAWWATYQYFWGLAGFVGMLLFFVYYMSIDLFNKVQHKNQWHMWYTRLAISRENGSKEFIESYRHLREHGNAFFIVLLEIALAIPIFMIVSLPSPKMEMKIALMLIVAFLWLSTGMLCWFLANSLEGYLIKTPSLQTTRQDQ